MPSPRAKKDNSIHPKVTAASLGAAVVTLLNILIHAVSGYDPTPAEVGAEVTIAAFAAGYFVSD